MILALASAAALAVCPPQGARVNCVVDGDTLWLNGEKIRIAEIDTPEINGRCSAERALALRARGRLVELLRAGPVRFQRVGKDRYGRTLARFGSVSEQLIREGLAHRWPSRKDWCG
jgi:endonuclease YncB( thermonuclease family)